MFGERRVRCSSFLTSQFIAHFLKDFCLNYITIIQRDHQSVKQEIDIFVEAVKKAKTMLS